MNFDIDISWGKNKSESDAYLTMLAEEYFYVAKDASVLELASHIGGQTAALLYNKPKKVICVEPSPVTRNCDIFNHPLITLYPMTANDYYKKHNETVDIVTCFGLFYHLHSPFHLVEQIVNLSNPKYIIIETLWSGDTNLELKNNGFNERLVFNYEEPNKPGNFFVDQGITTPVKMNIQFDYKYIRQAFIDSGYHVVKESVYNNKYDVDSKQGAAVTLFEKL